MTAPPGKPLRRKADDQVRCDRAAMAKALPKPELLPFRWRPRAEGRIAYLSRHPAGRDLGAARYEPVVSAIR
jgi:hypothetical protein